MNETGTIDQDRLSRQLRFGVGQADDTRCEQLVEHPATTAGGIREQRNGSGVLDGNPSFCVVSRREMAAHRHPPLSFSNQSTSE